MMIEIPFPIPRSVTCSPSHIRKMVPAVRVTTALNRNAGPVITTTGSPAPALWLCSAAATPNDWNSASTTVK